MIGLSLRGRDGSGRVRRDGKSNELPRGPGASTTYVTLWFFSTDPHTIRSAQKSTAAASVALAVMMTASRRGATAQLRITYSLPADTAAMPLRGLTNSGTASHLRIVRHFAA